MRASSIRRLGASLILVATAALAACGGGGDDSSNGGGGGGDDGGSGSDATSGGQDATPHQDANANGDGSGNGDGAGGDANGNGDDATTGDDASDANNGGDADGGSPPADSGSDAIPDAGNDGAFHMAPHPPAPQVLDHGGGTMHSPKVTSITFPGYALTTQVDDFLANVGSTAYWTAATSEYGVGATTTTEAVHLTEQPPQSIDDTAIATWLSDHLTGKADGGAPLPAPTSDSFYVIFYPATTTVTLLGGTSCTDFGGYHNSTVINGKDVVYAVVPQCDWVDPQGSPTTDGYLTTVTQATSHELVEGVSDPYPLTNHTTYTGLVEPDYTYWELAFFGNELGDMCSWLPTSYFTPSGFSYSVQRTWSNAAAAAGHDPCQPLGPGESIYFAGVPVLKDDVTINYQSQSYPTKGVHIPVGQKATIEVDLFSDGPLAAWTVSAFDYSAAASNGTPNLTFAWDKTSGKNGDKLHLTITVKAGDPQYGGNAFGIMSTSGSMTTYWAGYVGN